MFKVLCISLLIMALVQPAVAQGAVGGMISCNNGGWYCPVGTYCVSDTRVNAFRLGQRTVVTTLLVPRDFHVLIRPVVGVNLTEVS